MLNQIYIHYITTLLVLESFIISCWLLKGKKKIGIGIGQFARKKSVSESATKNHDRCITNFYSVERYNRSHVSVEFRNAMANQRRSDKPSLRHRSFVVAD